MEDIDHSPEGQLISAPIKGGSLEEFELSLVNNGLGLEEVFGGKVTRVLENQREYFDEKVEVVDLE